MQFWRVTKANFDPFDPSRRAYRRLYRLLRNLLLLAVVAVVVSIYAGVPHIQYTYRAYRTEGIPGASDKISADYWAPGFGWTSGIAGQYGHGCPIIAFIPLRDCYDLSGYEQNPILSALLPDDFFEKP